MKNLEKIIDPPAITAQTDYAEAQGKKIAYRSIGHGEAMIFCNRFRGTLDTWDPSFLDKLARKFRVVTFDYSGIGLSSGELATDIASVANDVIALANFLQLKSFILGGWSYGGLVAQTFATHFPELITHLVLIGTKPPGNNEYPTERIFIERSSKVHNDLDDEIILFFEPESKLSRKAAKRSHKRISERTEDFDIPVPEEVWNRYFKGSADFTLDTYQSRKKLAELNAPILVISGDHDIVFPIENWYALTRKLPNLQLVMLPQAGHGPQHQYPALTAQYISNFVKHTKF